MCATLAESEGALAFRYAIYEDQIWDSFKRNLSLVDGQIRVLEVTTMKEMEQFVQLPYKIYADNPIWPGQNDEEVMALFNPAINPSLAYVELQPFIAICDGEVVGRISACLNAKYNQKWGDEVGFFGYFECINDQSVANALFQTAEKWLKANGKEEVHGPISPTYMDVVGVLQDSFETMPIQCLSYNPSYYIKLYEKYGFQKEKDLYELTADTLTLYNGVQQKMEKIIPFLDDENIIARYFDRDNYERDSEIVRTLFHDSFRQHLGFYELDDQEWKNFLDHYLDLTHEDLFLIVEDAGEAIAFAIAFEDGNQKLHAKRHGYEENVTRQRLDLIGVKPDYIRNGIGTYVVYNMLPGLQAHQAEEFSISWIFEDNYNSIGLCKSLGMHVDKTYRVYSKAL